MFTAPTKANHDTTGSREGITWLAYLFLGLCFGITLTQSEVLSWFRIQEMFRFQSPRMYEIIASAVAVAAVSVALIKRMGVVKTISGEPIAIPPKTMGLGVRYAAGGTIFGLDLGTCRSLSRTDVRAPREWRFRDDRSHRQRAGRNLAVRIPETAAAALNCKLERFL
jgi:hypothetical protein